MNQLESLTCKDSLIHRNSHTINTHRLYLPRITLIYKKPRKTLCKSPGLFLFINLSYFASFKSMPLLRSVMAIRRT